MKRDVKMDVCKLDRKGWILEVSYLLLFMFYANTKSLKDDIPGVPQGNVGSIMRSCDYPQCWCYFSLIYEHDVLLFYMKLTKLCLTDV